MDISNSKIYIDKDGNKESFNLKGEYHRLDGPAIECSNGDKYWYKEDMFHREDGSAIEYINGDKFWYKEGECHRVDGPAREYSDGDKEWYLLFKELEESEFNSWMNRIRKFI